MNFCRFFNNVGFCTTCGTFHDGTFLLSGAYTQDEIEEGLGEREERDISLLRLQSELGKDDS